LNTAVDAALQRSKAVVLPALKDGESRTAQLCCPILLDQQPVALVAVEVADAGAEALEARMRTLRWNCAWLELFYRRRRAGSGDVGQAELVRIFNVLVSTMEHHGIRSSVGALVNELGSQWQCSRVSLGFNTAGHSRVVATSGVSEFSGKADLMRSIGCAMDEAIDQQASLVYPTFDDSAVLLNSAQQGLAEFDPELAHAVCTLPLPGAQRYIGALTLERPASAPFTEAELEMLELAGALLGPLLEEKQRASRPWWRVALDSAREQAQRLFGARYYGRKLVLGSIVLFLLFTGLYPADYRVTADARLESIVRRAVVAPVDGYVLSAEVRAGDLLNEGDALYALDDRDLKLEQLRWSSEKVQLQRQLRDALATREASRVRVIEAQLEQADAQLALVNEQLSRMHGVAPFAGYVISGDLSQSLGAPVSRGEVLFEIAPLDAYRVVVMVNERDIPDVAPGQSGSVVLRSGSESSLPFAVERVTPLAEAFDGANVFRVEANLSDRPAYLRPGMEGVAKIDAGERSLLWIWTHNFTRWLRLALWEWF
jgi:multidrug resistance efflux pump